MTNHLIIQIKKNQQYLRVNMKNSERENLIFKMKIIHREKGQLNSRYSIG
jgi:hypothetical protein